MTAAILKERRCGASAPWQVQNMNMFSLTGKKSIITGASRPTGLCFAQAQALHDAGAEVVLLGGKAKNLARMEELTGGAKNGYYIVPADLTDTEAREAAFAEALELLGGHLDILVNGAGFQYRCPAA